MAASTTGLPQKSRRASNHATAIPSGVAISVATVATRTESWIAVHSVGEISNTRSGGRSDQESESIFFKDRLGSRRTQEGEIVGGLRLRGRRRCDGIDDGGMGIRREGADDLDAGFDLGIGRIDYSEHRVAARYQRKCRAHVLCHGEFRLGGGPGANLLQGRLGI